MSGSGWSPKGGELGGIVERGMFAVASWFMGLLGRRPNSFLRSGGGRRNGGILIRIVEWTSLFVQCEVWVAVSDLLTRSDGG